MNNDKKILMDQALKGMSLKEQKSLKILLEDNEDALKIISDPDLMNYLLDEKDLENDSLTTKDPEALKLVQETRIASGRLNDLLKNGVIEIPVKIKTNRLEMFWGVLKESGFKLRSRLWVPSLGIPMPYFKPALNFALLFLIVISFYRIQRIKKENIYLNGELDSFQLKSSPVSDSMSYAGSENYFFPGSMFQNQSLIKNCDYIYNRKKPVREFEQWIQNWDEYSNSRRDTWHIAIPFNISTDLNEKLYAQEDFSESEKPLILKVYLSTEER